MRKISVLLFSTVLFSCSQNHSVESSAGEDSTQTISTTKEVELDGLYANDKFISCSDNQTLAIMGDTKKLDSLYKVLLPEAYEGQTIFAKLKGTLSNNDLSVKEVVQAEQKNESNTCIPYDYWCMGNEPFWRVQISEKENLIDFFNPMENTYSHFNFSKPEIKQNSTVYTAESGANKIKITITNEKCSDGMSERDYQYKSEAVLNGTVYKGCAVNASQK